MAPYSHGEPVGLIWSTAHLLLGKYTAHDYDDGGLDKSMADTRQAVLDREADLVAKGNENREPVLLATSGRNFYTTSSLSFGRSSG